jgi:hypothetical protein
VHQPVRSANVFGASSETTSSGELLARKPV